jgi:prolyl-tRNA synthetase
MRYSKFFVPTYKEIPADAEVVSHQLMLRAGLIRKLTSGIYTYLPAGLKSIRKLEHIIREEMDRSGAMELLMPSVQPADLWQESGRWELYGRELLRLKDRHNREACIGPTHEEVITDLVRHEIQSYKQMPVNFYQIQTKFRDEIRPRFGIMRGREFIMKDAYSFDKDEAGAEDSYRIMHETYCNIFRRCGLTFRAVEADTGTIGGSFSHEFMVLAETGEDQIVNCQKCSYAANIEKAEVPRKRIDETTNKSELAPLEPVVTPDMKTVEEVTAFLSISPDCLIKTLLFIGDGRVSAALVRGDHEINEAKLKAFLGVDQLDLADPETVQTVTQAPMGFAGPVGLDAPIVADFAIDGMVNAVTGGNERDLHLRNVNLTRDYEVERFGDLRLVTPEDGCPKCGGEISFGRGIEVGHIFKLGTKYSKAMNALFLDEQGVEKTIIMGCYGIGVGRTIAAAIEQNHDKNGIVFPIPIAPFEVVVLPLQMHEPRVIETAEKIYEELSARGVDVLIDDRDMRAGSKFKDADLLGTPVRLNIGKRSLDDGRVEMKLRSESKSNLVPLEKGIEVLLSTIEALYDKIQ